MSAALKVAQREPVWAERAWPLPSRRNVFRSGTNHPGEIRATLETGWHVGVSLPDLHPAGLWELEACADLYPDALVFADTGAFSEVEFDAAGVATVVKPITDEDWEEMLFTQFRICCAWGSRAYMVAPDRVGSQALSLERLERYAPQLRDMLALGANLIVPIPRGELRMAEFAGRANVILGQPWNIVWGAPMKKRATSIESLCEFAEDLAAVDHPFPRIHLLGLAPDFPGHPGERYLEALGAIRQVLPDAVVTCDSVRLRAMAGLTNGRGGKPRALSAARLDAVAEGVPEEQLKRVYVERAYRAELQQEQRLVERIWRGAVDGVVAGDFDPDHVAPTKRQRIAHPGQQGFTF